MIAVWHEGALGDLLLSRLAIAELAQRYGPLLLLARNEGRRLFKDCGWAFQTLSTEYGLYLLRQKPITQLFVFARTRHGIKWLEEQFPFKIQPVLTIPKERRHVALFQYHQIASEKITSLRGRTFKESGYTSKEGYLLVHPGSGSPRKCYPFSDWLQVLRALKDFFPIKVILGPAEEEQRGIWEEFQPCLSLHLEEALALLAGARGFVGHDSGVTHLAAALGIPTLALFGSTDPALWAPFGNRVRILYPFWNFPPARLLEEIFAFFNTTARFRQLEEPGKQRRFLAEGEPWAAGESQPEELSEEWPLQKPEAKWQELHRLGVEVVEAEAPR